MDHLLDFQRKFARDPNEVTDWSGAGEAIGLLSLVRSKSTGLKGLPVATIALPSVQRIISSGKASA
jgi:hypothetical protein